MASRRQFLEHSMSGFGALALHGMLGMQGQTSRAAGPAGVAHRVGAHFPARAKAVIYLYMEGGPSQVDTFDYKPELKRRAGEELPFEAPATVFNSSSKIFPSPWEFARHGDSGSWVSTLLPHLARHVDDLCFVHSLHHDSSNHSAGCLKSHTGEAIAGRPSMGSWMSYGLGTDNEELPAFCVLDCGQAPSAGAAAWSSGFLPGRHSGTQFLPGQVPIEFLPRLEESGELQEQKMSAIRALQERARAIRRQNTQVEDLIASYEKAASMQRAVPELLDLSGESEATKRLYGLDEPRTRIFGNRCLLARRLVERGVRFVEILSPQVSADRWDQHGKLKQGHELNCYAVDKPIAGLLRDLKGRGLLDDTIVLWGGEFGRTPTSQGSDGRDHNPFGYTVFLAGGGFRPGHFGTTDEFGYYAATDKVHLHDLHATILHQMGLDHERLTYRHGGRDYRLTDVYGRVVRELVG